MLPSGCIENLLQLWVGHFGFGKLHYLQVADYLMKADTIDLAKIREKIELIPYPGFSRSIAHFKIFDFVEIRDGKLFVSLNVNMRIKESYLTLKAMLKKS